MTETQIENQTQTQTQTTTEEINDINEIQQLKAKLNQLENKYKKLKNPKREYSSCECEICNKTFKNEYTLKTHMNTIHNEQRKTFICPHCGKSIKSKYYLQKHIRTVHADEIKVNSTESK